MIFCKVEPPKYKGNFWTRSIGVTLETDDPRSCFSSLVRVIKVLKHVVLEDTPVYTLVNEACGRDGKFWMLLDDS